MIERYNLDFDIAAVIIMLLEMIYVKVQYSHEKYSSRLFIMLLHSSFLLAIVDIFSSMMLTGEVYWTSKGVVKFTCSCYYLVSAFTIMVFYRYIVEYLGIKLEKTVSYYVLTYFPFFFTLECLFANCFANILFTGGKYGYFSYGPLISIIYYYPVYYFLLTIIQLIRFRKNVSIKQCLPVFAYMFATLVAIATQYVFQNVMLMPFAFAVALLIMMLSLETPDYRRLVKTTELLEAVRGEYDYQNEINEALILEMSKEVCAPIEKMLEKNKSFAPGHGDEAGTELQEYVNGYGEIIYSVVSNVVEFNSIGKNRQDLKPVEYSISELINDVRNIMLPAAKDTSNSIVVDIAPSIPDSLLGSAEELERIVINLVRESLECTQDGTITLGINGRKIESDGMNLIISVEDDGEGMDRDTVRKLVQFNTKSKKWNKDIFNGNYFKVRIAKYLIENMHGKLHIDSEVGKGTKYTIVLPQEIVSK